MPLQPRRPSLPDAGATTIDGVAEFIYSMQKVRKAHGDKVILDNVTLNFLPGAKIGVVGPNGAGKSTVLRIMAGLEHANNGEALLAPGATVGILQQEPPLNEEKTVLGNVEEGLGEIKQQLDRYNEIAEQMATDYSDALMEEMGAAAGDPRPRRCLGARLPARAGDGRAALPAGGLAGHAAVRRRAPPGGAVQAAAEQARPAAARRADQPPGRGERAVAGAAPGQLRGGDPRGHPRPVLPGQRGRSGSSRSTADGPTPTRATTPPTWRRRPSGSRCRAARTRSCASAWWTSWPGCGPAPRPGRRRAGPGCSGTRRWPPRPTSTASWTSRRSRSRRVPGWATSWSRSSTWTRASTVAC